MNQDGHVATAIKDHIGPIFQQSFLRADLDQAQFLSKMSKPTHLTVGDRQAGWIRAMPSSNMYQYLYVF